MELEDASECRKRGSEKKKESDGKKEKERKSHLKSVKKRSSRSSDKEKPQTQN